MNQLDDGLGVAGSINQNTFSQRRADAAVLMAETSLQAAGRDIANADRYQVIVSVDETDLVESHDGCSRKSATSIGSSQSNEPQKLPSRRALIKGAGAITRNTARRIACDCSLTRNITANGEPLDIGRKSRLWPSAMARAIKERDQHCQFYGCTQTRNLQIHHIKHWADGGSTSVSNGVCLCQSCHTKVHEGGFSIQRVDDNDQRLDELFALQQCANDLTLFDFEKALRNDRSSFDKLCKLMPTRYRFRVVDSQGRDIRNAPHVWLDEESMLKNKRAKSNLSRVGATENSSLPETGIDTLSGSNSSSTPSSPSSSSSSNSSSSSSSSNSSNSSNSPNSSNSSNSPSPQHELRSNKSESTHFHSTRVECGNSSKFKDFDDDPANVISEPLVEYRVVRECFQTEYC